MFNGDVKEVNYEVDKCASEGAIKSIHTVHRM